MTGTGAEGGDFQPFVGPVKPSPRQRSMCAAWREQVEEERPAEVGGDYWGGD